MIDVPVTPSYALVIQGNYENPNPRMIITHPDQSGDAIVRHRHVWYCEHRHCEREGLVLRLLRRLL